jgi:hypothetical protein
METLARRFTETSRLAKGGRAWPRPSKADLDHERHSVKTSSTPQAEWTILRTLPVNGLLIGALHLTAAAMARIDRTVRAPVVWWAPEQAVDVPDLTTGTLVIRDVDRLDERQQERLGQWIGAHCPRVQVLALARAPLLARVADGRFSPALYSRLNTVMVEVRGLADLP